MMVTSQKMAGKSLISVSRTTSPSCAIFLFRILSALLSIYARNRAQNSDMKHVADAATQDGSLLCKIKLT